MGSMSKRLLEYSAFSFGAVPPPGRACATTLACSAAISPCLDFLSGRFRSNSESRVSCKRSGCAQGGNMSRRISMGFCLSVLACWLAVVGLGVQSAWGQAGSQGSINVTVLDPDGKGVPDTQLAPAELSTNDIR